MLRALLFHQLFDCFQHIDALAQHRGKKVALLLYALEDILNVEISRM